MLIVVDSAGTVLFVVHIHSDFDHVILGQNDGIAIVEDYYVNDHVMMVVDGESIGKFVLVDFDLQLRVLNCMFPFRLQLVYVNGLRELSFEFELV